MLLTDKIFVGIIILICVATIGFSYRDMMKQLKKFEEKEDKEEE